MKTRGNRAARLRSRRRFVRWTRLVVIAACASASLAIAAPEAAATHGSEPVYFFGTTLEGKMRPSVLHIGASQIIYRARWRTWGRHIAEGRAVFPFNNCRPYCAKGRITNYRVRVRLSNVRRCASSEGYEYLRLSWTFTGAKPPRTRRLNRANFGYQC